MKMYPLLNYAPCHEDVWEMEVQLHAFLNLALDGGEWSASCPDCFTPRKEPPVPIG